MSNICYTQSSIGTYLKCPYKYYLTYIKKIYWKEEEELEEPLKKGRDFHLIAERYYKGIDQDLEDEYREKLETLTKKYPKKERAIYLSEYIVKEQKEGRCIYGRYDLLIVEEVSKDEVTLEIVDYKTNKKEMDIERTRESIQTKVYLYLLYRNQSLVLKKEYKKINFKMSYYQSGYPDRIITIDYNKENYLEGEKELKKLLFDMEKTNLEEPLKIKVRHCIRCEFDKICWKKEKKVLTGF